MVKQKLIDYVQSQIQNGKSEEQIKKDLIKVRWDEKTIKEIFDEINKTNEIDGRELESFKKGEFDDLEEKESKTLFGSNKEPVPEKPKPKCERFYEMSTTEISHEIFDLKNKLDQVYSNVEKEEGKVELEGDVIKSINERIGDLSQEIGEIRQTVLSRERYFNKMESEFEKMKDAISTIKPQKIEEKFEKSSEELIKIQAANEKLSEKINMNTEKLDSFSEVMSKIKNFESILLILKEMKGTVSEVTRQKEYTEGLVNKQEMLFKELSDSIMQISDFETKLSEYKGLLNTTKNDVNKLNATVEGYPKKAEIKKVEKNVETILSMMLSKDAEKFQ